MRTFRLSRMTGATVLASGFERPAKFDLASHWSRTIADMAERQVSLQVVLALAPTVVQTLVGRCPTSPVTLKSRASHVPEGWVTLKVEFGDEDQARFVILGMGARAQVLEPRAFRQKILTEVQAMAAAL
jgi:predicted DNA-binding transcriptional regulator YafY